MLSNMNIEFMNYCWRDPCIHLQEIKMEPVRAIFVGGPKDGEGILLEQRNIRSAFEFPIIPPRSIHNCNYDEPLPLQIFIYKAYYLGHYNSPELIIYFCEKEFKSVSDVIKHLALNYTGPML